MGSVEFLGDELFVGKEGLILGGEHLVGEIVECVVGLGGSLWVTNSDPAFLRILARSERYKLRYDAAKQLIPRVEVL